MKLKNKMKLGLASVFMSATAMLGRVTQFAQPMFKARREEYHNALADSPHPHGNVTMSAEFVAGQTQLLVKQGTGAGKFLLCVTATDDPMGVLTDTPAIGERGNVRLLGAATGTVVMRNNGSAIPAGSRVYTAGAGLVTAIKPAAGQGYLVGRAQNTTSIYLQEIEVAPCFPVLV